MSEPLQNLREQIVQQHGNYTKILPLTLEMLTLTGQIHGEHSTEYAVALNDLGGVYRHLGQYPDSEQVFLEAVNILTHTVGTTDPNYATVLNNLAGLYRLMKAYEKSEKLFQLVRTIYEQTLGKDHFLSISALNNLGLLYQDIERYDEAKKLHEQCLILLKNQNEHPIAYATTLNNLANLHEKNGDLNQAVQLMNTVTELYQQKLGAEHPLYANALNNFAALLYKQGDLVQAQSYFLQAKDINQKTFGVDSKVYQSSVNNLNMITRQLKTQTVAKKTVVSVATEKPVAQVSEGSYGMSLCQRYFESVCFPVLTQVFSPGQIEQMAIGLVGEGSECFGFDDEISRDHDFGARIMVWLNQQDYADFGEQLQQVLNCIPKEQAGFPSVQASSWAEGREGVFSIEAFYAKFTGLPHLPQTLNQWRAIPEKNLATATNGQIFFDPSGQFSRVRYSLLNFYPEDVRLKKMAARCMQIAQAGQYNFPRCVRRKDNVAASMAAAEFTDAAISLVFLLNRRYKPFYKWMHRGLKDLPVMGGFTYALMEGFSCMALADRIPLIEAFSATMIKQLQQEKLTDSGSDFLLDHGPRLLQNIQDTALRSSNPWVE